MKTPYLTLIIAAAVLAGCSTVPYTNRKQFNLVSEGEEVSLGNQAFQEVLTKSKISQDAQVKGQVERVGQKIAAASNKPDYKWEFTVIDDPKTMNAFCLPGGKVAVYTGLLPVTKDDAGLAVVMSHEVAHALARHGAERMSEQMAANLALQAAVVSGAVKTQAGANAVQMAYGIGVGLPHSRAQESEADQIGLILMAKAGYDPRVSIDFWTRMQEASKGAGKPPEFLSTHPSDETRIAKIKKELPEALKHYQGGGATTP